MFGFFIGGWISQQLGKRIMMVVSNFASFIIWIMLAFGTDKVEFIILGRFLMGVFSAGAIVCVGEFVVTMRMYCVVINASKEAACSQISSVCCLQS